MRLTNSYGSAGAFFQFSQKVNLPSFFAALDSSRRNKRPKNWPLKEKDTEETAMSNIEILTTGRELDIPVALFVFNRPALTLQSFTAVEAARPKKLFLVADGPRDNFPLDSELVKQVRSIVENVSWECEVVRVFADKNLGLRLRFETALDEIFSQEKAVIIVEDDCVPSSSFFAFQENLLRRYANGNSVGIVAGYNFAPPKDQEGYFFDLNGYVWGWGTWSRVWHAYRADFKEFAVELDASLNRKSFEHWFERLMVQRLVRKMPSLGTWDVPFTFFLRKSGYLNVVPKVNMVSNIGFNCDATNTSVVSWEQPPISSEMSKIPRPEAILQDVREVRKMWSRRSHAFFKYCVAHPAWAMRTAISMLQLPTFDGPKFSPSHASKRGSSAL